MVLCGISTCFQVLSPCMGQIVHALLTRPPLEHNLPSRRTSSYLLARLACVKHAASVRPEPGSNSYVQSFTSSFASLPPRQRLPLRDLAGLALSFLTSSLAQLPASRRSRSSWLSTELFPLLCIVFKVRSPPRSVPRSRQLC